jgi:excisionase family DNA binding protein
MDLNLEDLLDDLADRIAVRLRIPAPVPPVGPRLLDVEAAAEYLGRTKQALLHLIAADALPTVRTDRRVMLDKRDLDKWIEAHKGNGKA